jgi:hypothetical protein
MPERRDVDQIEGRETVRLTLANAGGTGTINTDPLRNTTTLRIEDNDLLLNEVLVNARTISPAGDDSDIGYEFIELLGTPGATLTGIYLVAFNNTPTVPTNPSPPNVPAGFYDAIGVADIVIDLSSVTLGSSGLAVIRAPGTFNYWTTAPAGVTEVIAPELDPGVDPLGKLKNNGLTLALIRSPNTPITQGTDYVQPPNAANAPISGTLTSLPSDASWIDSVGWTQSNGNNQAGSWDAVVGLGGAGVRLGQANGNPDAASRFNGETVNDLLPNNIFSWFGGHINSPLNPTYADPSLYRSTSNLPAGGAVTPGLLNTPRAISIAQASYTGYELSSPTTVTVTLKRTGLLSNEASVQYTLTPGTATAGSDYTAVSGTMTFLANETEKTFDITILPDSIPEGDETFTISIFNPQNITDPPKPYSLGLATSTVTIVDDDTVVATFQDGFNSYTGTRDVGLIGWLPNDPAGSDLSISVDQADNDPTIADDPNVPMQALIRFDDLFGSGPGQIPVGSQIFSVSLQVNVTSSTALTTQIPLYQMLQSWNEANATFTAPNAAIVNGVIPDGVEAASSPDTLVPVSALTTGIKSIPLPTSTVQAWANGAPNNGWLMLSNSSDGWDFDTSEALNDANRPKLKIVYLAPTGPGSFTFQKPTFTVSEASATATITVDRVGGSAGEATVTYTAAVGTADSSDFTEVTSTLTFADGEISKTFDVSITPDNVPERDETVNLSLSNPTNGAGLIVAGTNATLVIRNDDQVPLLLLNEISVNPPSTDQPFEYIELIGTANAGLGGYFVVVIEGDQSASPLIGEAENVFSLGSFNNGSAGLTLIKAASGGHTAPSGTTVITSTDLNTGTLQPLENGSTSFLLLFNPTATINQFVDFDWNNNGTIEMPAGTILIDQVGWKDADALDVVYTTGMTPVILTQTTGTPSAATRFLGNTTALSAAAWYNGNIAGTLNSDTLYDQVGGSTNLPLGAQLTPGAPNVTRPNVSSVIVNGVGVVSASESGLVATITTDAPHLLSVGQSVTLANVSVAGYNGTFTVTNVLDATSFEYSVTGPLAAGTGGLLGTPDVQRSLVTSIRVTFDSQVTLGVGAFTLTGTDIDGNTFVGSPSFAVTTQVIGGVTVATLTFSGTNTEDGSLADGIWTLTANASAISNAGGNMAADYISDADTTLQLAGGVKRLFGDINGDNSNDFSDSLVFSSTFNLSTVDAGYLAAFDVNADGTVDTADLLAFSARAGLAL